MLSTLLNSGTEWNGTEKIDQLKDGTETRSGYKTFLIKFRSAYFIILFIFISPLFLRFDTFDPELIFVFKKKTEKTSDLKCMTLMGSSLLFLFYFLQVPNHDHSCIFFHVLPRFQKLAHLPEQNSYVICIQISTDRMSNIAWIIINSLTVRVTDPACLMLALHRFINTANYSF